MSEHPRPWMAFASDSKAYKPLVASALNSTFRYRDYDRFVAIEQRRTDHEGGVGYHNVYLVSQPISTVVAANIDDLIPKVLSISATNRMLLFRIENNFPKFAQGLHWKWPTNAGIIVSRFLDFPQMRWFACVVVSKKLDELRTPDALRTLIESSDGSFSILFQICAQIYREVNNYSPSFYVGSALRGALAGALFMVDKEYRQNLRKQLKDWTPLLAAIEGGDEEVIGREVMKLYPASGFVAPRFLDGK